MKVLRRLLFSQNFYFSLFLILSLNLFSADLYECELYDAFVDQNMEQYPPVLNKLQDQYNEKPSKHMLLQITFTQYGYLGYLIGTEQNNKAEKLLIKAQDNLEIISNNYGKSAVTEALKAAFYAYEIALHNYKAMRLGPASLRHINNAIELDPKSPYGWVEKANAAYHMPKIIGGSYTKAIKYYKKAISIFENDNQYATRCNWYYLNTLLWLTNSYIQAEKEEKAKETAKKMLSISPGYKEAQQLLEQGEAYKFEYDY